MEQFTNEKSIINAQNAFGDTLTCIERQIGIEPDGTTPINEYITIEHDTDSEHHLNLCIFKSLEEMIQNVTWHTWILQGVKSPELQKLITK